MKGRGKLKGLDIVLGHCHFDYYGITLLYFTVAHLILSSLQLVQFLTRAKVTELKCMTLHYF